MKCQEIGITTTTRTYPVELVPIASHNAKDSLDAKAFRFLGHATKKAKFTIEHFGYGAAYQGLRNGECMGKNMRNSRKVWHIKSVRNIQTISEIWNIIHSIGI